MECNLGYKGFYVGFWHYTNALVVKLSKAEAHILGYSI